MPIFGSKFSPKKTPQRRKHVDLSKESLVDLFSDQKTVQLKLGEQELLFERGDWIPQTGQNGNTYKSKQKLKNKVQELEEENNLLRLKYEMMLNMLTQAQAEGNLQQLEKEKTKKKRK
ncbi:hypothetical protein JTB14_016681 [Gonioctena quinquepunctata]|nr:hypothetical protein JTB14_016681 [Gonioctena quinquepunctata]